MNRDMAFEVMRSSTHHEFTPGRFAGRYYNSCGYACAVVASLGYADDWAAYIGGCPGENEEGILTYVAAYGTKLSEKDARHYFPELAEMAYRR